MPALNENGFQVDSTAPFHSVVLQLSLASRQVTLKLGRNRSGPEVRVALNRALTESVAVGLRRRALKENSEFNVSGHLAVMVWDAQSQFSVMPLLKFRPDRKSAA